jgi:hypothetical protein
MPRYPLDRGLGVPQSRPGRIVENSYPHQYLNPNPLVVQPIASHYTLHDHIFILNLPKKNLNPVNTLETGFSFTNETNQAAKHNQQYMTGQLTSSKCLKNDDIGTSQTSFQRLAVKGTHHTVHIHAHSTRVLLFICALSLTSSQWGTLASSVSF